MTRRSISFPALVVLLGVTAPLAAQAPSATPPSLEEAYGAASEAYSPSLNLSPEVRLAQATGQAANDATAATRPSVLPPGARQGVFQKLNLGVHGMPRLEDDSVGATGLEADIVLGFPFPERESPLLITPAYRVLYLDGPDFTDVPPRVHDAEVDFHHFRQLTDRWLVDLAVTLGVYADDHSFDAADAFRVSGRGLGIYDFENDWKGVLGVIYLNRAGYSVVPAAGLMYDSGDFKLDLLFPRPRAAWRIMCLEPGINERWFYVQGDFGGSIWAVQRASGATDNLAYRDLRVVVGLERKLVGGWSRRWELGYVFDRAIEYDSEGVDRALDDTVFVRAGLTY